MMVRQGVVEVRRREDNSKVGRRMKVLDYVLEGCLARGGGERQGGRGGGGGQLLPGRRPVWCCGSECREEEKGEGGKGEEGMGKEQWLLK